MTEHVDAPGDAGRGAGIQVIARAADILRALSANPGGLSQADLVEHLGLARTTVHRMVNALVAEGLVGVSRGRGRYQLGPEIARMATTVRRDLVAGFHPLLESLSARLQETVDLSMLEGSRVVFLDQVTAPQRLRAVSAVGESFPVHACAPGKALLAGLAHDEISAVVPGRLEPLTSRTITSFPALMSEITGVRQAGVAFDREEHTEGICALAVALDQDGGSRVAISVPMPSQRFYGREEQLAEQLRSTVEEWPSLFA
ncbi:IclR family transcriptional regulator [Jatrophihabitans fulvus]